MHQRTDTVLVVIDPQRAFVDPAGSVARTFGADDMQPGVAALERLRRFLAQRPSTAPAIFVRSEFQPGQFTDGDLNHGMANVCVPGRGIDCDWAAGIEIAAHDVVVTKHQADAVESGAFRHAIEQAIAGGVTRIVFVGFQFTTCVVASAASTVALVRARGVRVAVVEPLTGSRVSSHQPGPSGVSRIEATRRQLEAAGVELVTTNDWLS
jgi:nicotinamidase-related amidase